MNTHTDTRTITPIIPGALLGVLGGGQLGRMFALAARRMGYRVAVFTPEGDSPAGQVADLVVRAEYDDLEAVEDFARRVAAVTFEFENVPAASAGAAASLAPLRPGPALLSAAQDRLIEKRELARLGIPVANYVPLIEEADLARAAQSLPGPAVLKTARLGYDGKGQRRLGSASDLPAAWESLGRTACVVEELVPFEGEISIIGARGVDGDVALYEPFANVHEHHVLDLTVCPAPVDPAITKEAQRIARRVLEGLDVVGVLCVEFFYLADGRVLVNEIAPRPHNSGHLTIDAHECSQFEQQVRALCGLPLGSTRRLGGPAAMVNLLGDLWLDGEPDWSSALAHPGLHLHLYGKQAPRPGRKMGHLTLCAATLAEAASDVQTARQSLNQRRAEGRRSQND